MLIAGQFMRIPEDPKISLEVVAAGIDAADDHWYNPTTLSSPVISRSPFAAWKKGRRSSVTAVARRALSSSSIRNGIS